MYSRETFDVIGGKETLAARLARIDSAIMLSRDFRCYWRQGDWLQKLQADFAYSATEKSKNSAVKAGRLRGFRQNKGAFFQIAPYNNLIYSTL